MYDKMLSKAQICQQHMTVTHAGPSALSAQTRPQNNYCLGPHPHPSSLLVSFTFPENPFRVLLSPFSLFRWVHLSFVFPGYLVPLYLELCNYPHFWKLGNYLSVSSWVGNELYEVRSYLLFIIASPYISLIILLNMLCVTICTTLSILQILVHLVLKLTGYHYYPIL